MNLRSSLIWSYANQYGMMVIQFASSIALARLLLPEEIGVFSVALSLVAFGQMIRDFGIGEYLIQEKHLTPEKIQTGFILSVALSWALALVVLLLSTPVAEFYDQPALAEIFPLIAFNFLLIPIGSITMALLRKEMRFDAITRIQLTSSLVQPGVSVVLAYLGFSYMSLAWGVVAGTLTTVLLSQFYRAHSFSLTFSLEETKAIITYGKYNLITNISATLINSAPDIIIGKLLNMHLVGIFNRGLGLLNMISNLIVGGIRPVLLPYFSLIHKQGNSILSDIFLKATGLLLLVTWPALSFIILYSGEIILFLFGKNWIEAAPVLSTLSIGSMIGMANAFSQEILKSTGNIKALSSITLYSAIIRVVAILAGCQFSLQVTLYFLVGAITLQTIITYLRIISILDIPWSSVISVALRNTLATGAIIFPCYIAKELFNSSITLMIITGSLTFAFTLSISFYFLEREIFYKILFNR